MIYQLKTKNLSAVKLKTFYLDELSPRYGHVILVSGYPVLTAVNIYNDMNVQNLVAGSHIHTS